MTDHNDEIMKETLLRTLRSGFPGMKEEYEEVAWVSYCLGWEVSLGFIRDQFEGNPSEHGPHVGILKNKLEKAEKDKGIK